MGTDITDESVLPEIAAVERMTRISGSVIVVTGASSGIGAAAKAMARRGGRVALLARTQLADALVRAVEGNRRQVIVPFMLWLFAATYRFFPRPVEGRVHGTGWRRSHS